MVIPLALYLLTYVIVFQTKRIVTHEFFVWSQPPLIAALIALLILNHGTNISVTAGINYAAFFVTAMVCHGELAQRRPAAQHLTAFYLWIAIGGLMGGIFAGLAAPYLFNWVVEYPLLIVASVLCRPGLVIPRDRQSWLPILAMLFITGIIVIAIRMFGIWPQLFNGMIGVGLVLAVLFLSANPFRLATAFGCVLMIIHAHLGQGSNVQMLRSFFGVHKIYEIASGAFNVRVLLHGTTVHGAQLTSGPHVRTNDGKPVTVTYYGPRSPMARAFNAVIANKRGPIRVAVIGLGTGTLACFARPEDELHFYEIDKAVVRIAVDPTNFDYISSCKPDSRIIVGDARLTITEAPNAHYDLIVLDAFSSDAVPVHLLTREAMALYLSKLTSGGLIVSNVTNWHLELSSVVAGIAAANGLVTRVMHSYEYDPHRYILTSSAAVVARSDKDFGALLVYGDWIIETPDPAQWVWTDDYSNVVGAMIRRMRQ